MDVLTLDPSVNKEEFFQLWRGYVYETVTSDQFLAYAKSAVVRELYRFSYRLTPDQCEDLVSDTLMGIWGIMKRKSFPLSTDRRFWAYFYKCMLREMYAFARVIETEEEEKFWFEGYVRDRLPERSSDVGLCIEDLPIEIRRRALRGVLPGRSDAPKKSRGAVKYILNRLLKGETVRRDWLFRHYRVRRPEFLCDYAKVRARMAVQQVAAEFQRAEDREQILDAGYELLERSQ